MPMLVQLLELHNSQYYVFTMCIHYCCTKYRTMVHIVINRVGFIFMVQYLTIICELYSTYSLQLLLVPSISKPTLYNILVTI